MHSNIQGRSEIFKYLHFYVGAKEVFAQNISTLTKQSKKAWGKTIHFNIKVHLKHYQMLSNTESIF